MQTTASPTIEKVHVTRTPGVCGGKPCIAGTRIRVWDIATLTRLGDSPEEILCAYPHITLSDIYSALSYYYDFKEEIDQQAKEDEEFVEELRKKIGPGLMDQWRAEQGIK